jgi:hypothetical protein
MYSALCQSILISIGMCRQVLSTHMRSLSDLALSISQEGSGKV